MSLCTKPVNVVKARNIGHAVVDDVVNVVLSSIVDGELPVSGVLTSKSSHISSKDTGNLKPAEVKRRQVYAAHAVRKSEPSSDCEYVGTI
jgi:hypothetical protein